jgi:hypothetical protein
MHYSVQSVSPKRAAEFLEKNIENRPLSPKTIVKYSEAMKRGEWSHSNAEFIKFTGSGELVDGQHRLYGIIQSKRTVKVLVAKGVSKDAFHTIDQGKKRSCGDILGLIGQVNSNNLSSLLSLIYRQELGILNSRTTTPTNTQILELLDAHPKAVDSLAFAQRLFKTGTITCPMPSSLGGFLHYWASKNGHKQKVEEFLEGVMVGENIVAGSVAYRLRDRLLKNKLERFKKIDRSMVLALSIKAWNAHRDGKSIRTLVFRKSEQFPTL